MPAQLNDSFLDQALLVARDAGAAAAPVIAKYYRSEFVIETKADQSPVTIADRECEIEIKRVIRNAYPDHGIYGEEFGRENLSSDFLWLIDPIDGTKSFVRGYPFFSTQIALMHRGELVLGVSAASQFCETAWARRGGGAFLNGARIQISAVDRIEAASISTGNIKTLSRDQRWQAFANLVQRANKCRGYGDFYHYHLLARGACDAVIESDVNILDIAALVVLVREAGGVFTDLDGLAPTLETTSVLAATPPLHAFLQSSFER